MLTMSPFLYGAVALLMVDAAIELACISATVAWLHSRAGGFFLIEESNVDGGLIPLGGRPKSLLVDQGHTSNGAAGTAFVLVGLGGILALFLRSRGSKVLYHTWLVLTILSMLLSLAALIFTFIVTYQHDNQTIDLALTALSTTSVNVYDVDEWTPENWLVALRQLPLRLKSDRTDITIRLHIVRAWRWNLIALFLLGLAVCVLAVVEGIQRRRETRRRIFGDKHSVAL